MRGCRVMLFIFTVNKQVENIHYTCVLSELVLHHPQTEAGRWSSARTDSLHRYAPGWPSERAAGFGRREGERVRQAKVKGKGGGGALQCR